MEIQNVGFSAALEQTPHNLLGHALLRLGYLNRQIPFRMAGDKLLHARPEEPGLQHPLKTGDQRDLPSLGWHHYAP
jgi:hypothetical protein